MRSNEFKAWFDGFTENISGRPTDKQWRRIKKRVDEIDDVAITPHWFEHHYYRPYRRYYGEGTSWAVASSSSSPIEVATGTANVLTAMRSAGNAEALSLIDRS